MAIYDHPVKALNGSAASLADYRARPRWWSTSRPSVGSPRSTRGSRSSGHLRATAASPSSGSRATSSSSRSRARPTRSRSSARVNYGVTFPLFAKIDVNGDDQDPLYAELNQAADVADGHTGDIRWNFEKFLGQPDGRDRRPLQPDRHPRGPRPRRRHRGPAPSYGSSAGSWINVAGDCSIAASREYDVRSRE